MTANQKNTSKSDAIKANATRGENTTMEVFGVGYRIEPRSNGQLAVYRIKRNSASRDSILIGRADDATRAVEMINKDREEA